jgi:hypothetical protein
VLSSINLLMFMISLLAPTARAVPACPPLAGPPESGPEAIFSVFKMAIKAASLEMSVQASPKPKMSRLSLHQRSTLHNIGTRAWARERAKNMPTGPMKLIFELQNGYTPIVDLEIDQWPISVVPDTQAGNFAAGYKFGLVVNPKSLNLQWQSPHAKDLSGGMSLITTLKISDQWGVKGLDIIIDQFNLRDELIRSIKSLKSKFGNQNLSLRLVEFFNYVPIHRRQSMPELRHYLAILVEGAESNQQYIAVNLQIFDVVTEMLKATKVFKSKDPH